MNDTISPEAIAALGPEAPQREYSLNKPILDLILESSKILIEKYPDLPAPYVVYEIVTKTLLNQNVRSNKQSMVSDIFVYYLESYKRYCESLNIADTTSEEHLNDAVLYIFNLYLDRPNNHTLRQILILAASAIRDTVNDRLGKDKDINMQSAMGVMFNLTLLAETVKDYTKSITRKKNLLYIEWLRSALEKSLVDKDYDYIKTDKTVVSVIKQITQKHKVIFPTEQ